jgi:Macrocin-O-methyltransferase (TylF)
MEPAQLYLELLKRCLLDLVHADDPLAAMVPAGVAHRRRSWRAALRAANRALDRAGLMLVEPMRTPYSGPAEHDADRIRALREEGADWPVRAHTMVGRKRLDHLQRCVETVLREGIPGDLIETGVWRGGCCILMRAVLAAFGDADRRVWVADSFRGLPPPDANWPADAGSDLHRADFLAIPRATVENNFRAFGLYDDRVRFLEGWFEDTLPTAPIERLAVLRLDGDMYARPCRCCRRSTTASAPAASSSSTTTPCPPADRRSLTSAPHVGSTRRSRRSTGPAPGGARRSTDLGLGAHHRSPRKLSTAAITTMTPISQKT